MHGHHVNEEVVADLRIGIDALGVSLSDSLSENAGVFRVEKQVDASQFGVLTASVTIAVPVASVHLAVLLIRVDKDGAPFAGTIGELAETSSRNRLEVSLLVVA